MLDVYEGSLEGFSDPLLPKGATPLPQPEKEIGYLDAAQRGVRENHIYPLVANAPKSTDDKSWALDAEKAKSLAGDLSTPELRDYVLKAGSEEEAQERRQIALSRQETMKMLAQSGWDKTASYVLASMFDPTEIAAVTATTAGLGTIPDRIYAAYKGVKAVNTISKAEKVKRFTDVAHNAKIGGVGGMTEAAIFEGIRAAYQPDASMSDLPLYIAFGGALGAGSAGGAAAWRRAKLSTVYDKRMASGIPLTAEEEEMFGDIIKDRNLTTAVERHTVGGSMADGVDVPKFEVGANETAPKQLGSNFLAFGMRGKISAVARAMNSESGDVRALAPKLGLNSAGNTNRDVVGFGANEIQSYLQASESARVLPDLHNARDNWVQRTFGKSWNPIEMEGYKVQFNEMITKALRRGLLDGDSDVLRSAKKFRESFTGLYEQAKKYKARGFGEKELDLNTYVPRIHDHAKIDEAVQKVGRDQVVRLVKEAIIKKQSIDDNVAEMIADGYLHGIETRAARSALPNGMVVKLGIKEDTLEALREALTDKLKDTAKVDELMGTIERAVPTKPTGEGVARSRTRIDLDETHSITLNDGSSLSFEDLLVNDIEDLHTMYSFQMGGAIGLARNGLEVEGGDSIETILQKIADNNATGKRIATYKLQEELDALKFMYDGITGQLAHQHSVGATGETILRRIRDYNYITSMGSSGLSSMVEAANVLMDHNVKTIAKNLPEMRNLIKKAKDGNLDDSLLREMQHAFGVGMDVWTGRARTNWDEIETEFIRSDYTKVDKTLAYGRNKVSMLSGMLPITAVLRRADGMFYAYDWEGAAKAFAKSGKYKAPFAKIKMEQLGIDEPTGTKIMQMINQYAKYDDKGKLIALNIDDWSKSGADGAKAAEAFKMSGYRHAMQSVQDPSLGSLNRTLRTPWGKTLGQFLSYTLAAQEQQLQRLAVRATHGDLGSVFRVTAAAAMVSSMVYYTRTLLNAQGKSEMAKQEYLEKKLDPTAFVFEGTLGYMGMLSMYSTAIQRFNGNSLISNPTIDFVQNVNKMGKSLASITVGDKELKEDELRAWLRMLPLQNFYPMAVVNNMIADTFTDQ